MRKWQFLWYAGFLTTLIGLLALPPGAPKAAKSKATVHNLTVLYTTDLYGQLRDFRCKRPGVKGHDYEPAARDISNLLYQVNSIRNKILAKTVKDPNNGVLLFNTGDNLATAASARFLMEFKGLSGVDFIANVFARFGYQLIGLGNHEFSVKPERLRDFIKQCRPRGLSFSVANLMKDKKIPAKHMYAKELNFDSTKQARSRYFTFNVAGLKVGAFHVVPEGMEKRVSYASGLKFVAPSTAIEKIVPVLRKKEKVDLVIMLSHLDNGSKGKNIRELLQNDDDEKRIDVVITNGLRNDSGTPLSSIVLSGKYPSRIIGGFKYGKMLGRVDLRVIRQQVTITDDDGNPKKVMKAKVQSFHSQSIPLEDNRYDVELRRNLIKWERSYCKRWGKPLGRGKIRGEMSREQFVKYFLNYMRMLASAEISAINNGAIRDGSHFPFKGYITKDDLYRAIPFPQTMYVRTIKGSELEGMSNKEKLTFAGYDGSNVNGRAVVANGTYRMVVIEYVAENKGSWFNGPKGDAAIKKWKWKLVRYANNKVAGIRTMMVKHFETNSFQKLPFTPPPKPEDDDAKKKKPKPFSKWEIPLTGNFYRLEEKTAWFFKTGLILSLESIITNPINLSNYYGDSNAFTNQFFQKYQVNGEWNMEIKLHTSRNEWTTNFIVGYTVYASRQFSDETAQETNIVQEERDEVKLQTKYVLRPFAGSEKKWYHTNPFVRGTVQTEITQGNRPDLVGFRINPGDYDVAKTFFDRSGESELYRRFQFEAELGLTFNIEKAKLNLDISFTTRRQLAVNPFTAINARANRATVASDLSINTDFNIGGSVKAELSEELQLFKVGGTPFVWKRLAVRYTLLFQVGAFVSGLLIHDFELKNQFAFKLQGNVELAFGADLYLYRGVFKSDPEDNTSFQSGPLAFRIDPKISLNVSWGARGQDY